MQREPPHSLEPAPDLQRSPQSARDTLAFTPVLLDRPRGRRRVSASMVEGDLRVTVQEASDGTVSIVSYPAIYQCYLPVKSA